MEPASKTIATGSPGMSLPRRCGGVTPAASPRREDLALRTCRRSRRTRHRSSPKVQDFQPKPQRVPHPIHGPDILLEGADSPSRTAHRGVVAEVVPSQHLRIQTFDPLAQLNPKTAKQFVEIVGLLAVGGGHGYTTSAVHGDTLTKRKSMVNQKIDREQNPARDAR
jgi:hypothetical protein